MDNKITYLERQLKNAISNSDYNEAERFYNNLLELGVPKEKLEYTAELFNKNKKMKWELLEKLAEELKETTDFFENKDRKIKKYSKIAIVIGIVLLALSIAIGVIGVDYLSYDVWTVLFISTMILGCLLFIAGFILFFTNFNPNLVKRQKEIYTKYLDKGCFETFMLAKWSFGIITQDDTSYNMYLAGIMQKGAFYKGDTLYLGGELYEVLDVENDFNNLKEKLNNVSEVEKNFLSSGEMVYICISREKIKIPKGAIYAIKV